MKRGERSGDVFFVGDLRHPEQTYQGDGVQGSSFNQGQVTKGQGVHSLAVYGVQGRKISLEPASCGLYPSARGSNLNENA